MSQPRRWTSGAGRNPEPAEGDPAEPRTDQHPGQPRFGRHLLYVRADRRDESRQDSGRIIADTTEQRRRSSSLYDAVTGREPWLRPCARKGIARLTSDAPIG